MTKRDREPPAPTPLDEYASAASLRSSPWIEQRLRELRFKGRLVKGWTPPVIDMPQPNESRPWHKE